MGQIVLSHACTSRCLTQYYKFIMNAVDGAVGGVWGALKAVGGLRCPLTPLWKVWQAKRSSPHFYIWCVGLYLGLKNLWNFLRTNFLYKSITWKHFRDRWLLCPGPGARNSSRRVWFWLQIRIVKMNYRSRYNAQLLSHLVESYNNIKWLVIRYRRFRDIQYRLVKYYQMHLTEVNVGNYICAVLGSNKLQVTKLL